MAVTQQIQDVSGGTTGGTPGAAATTAVLLQQGEGGAPSLAIM